MPDQKKVIMLKTCEIMQYWKYMDCNEIAVVISRIKSLANLKTWCIITHDKDVLLSGETKSPHFHAVLTFSSAKTLDSIARAIGVQPQYINKIKTTTKSAQLYLIHRNDPGKYQYPPQDVQASFDYVNFADDCPVKQKRDNIAELIEKGEIKEYNIFKYITIDEFSRNKRYYQNCFEYRQGKLKGLDRQMECIFITGASGTGKSTYAKIIASQRGYATYISSGGKNPLDNYKGEECIILDDTRSSTWSLTDFLKLTDNHTDSLVGCRYYNKSIAECKLLIVTSCKNLNDFYENAIKEDNEPRKQLFRRFSMYIKLDMENMYLSYYEESEARHKHFMTCKNPVSVMFQPEIAKKACEDFAKAMGLEPIQLNKELVDDQLTFIDELPF